MWNDLAERDLNHSASYDEEPLSIPLFHTMSLYTQSRYRLNMLLLITERDAVGLICVTYEYGNLGFSDLRKTSRCGSAGRSYEFGDRAKPNKVSKRPLTQASLRCTRWLNPSSLHRIPTPWVRHGRLADLGYAFELAPLTALPPGRASC
jgi:hypothetical protein